MSEKVDSVAVTKQQLKFAKESSVQFGLEIIYNSESNESILNTKSNKFVHQIKRVRYTAH